MRSSWIFCLGGLFGLLAITLTPLASRAAIFADGFEVLPAGSFLSGTLLPQPEAVLPADAKPLIQASFVPWPQGTALTSSVRIDGQTYTGASLGERSLSLQLTEALTEGNHDVQITISDGLSPRTINWQFTTRTSPSLISIAPFAGQVAATNEAPTIAASFYDLGAGMDSARTRIRVDNTDYSDALRQTAPFRFFGTIPVLPEGPHQISLLLVDLAGNEASMTHTFYVGSAVEVSDRTPIPWSTEDATRPLRVSVRIATANAALSADAIHLLVDELDLTAQAQITFAPDGKSATLSIELPALSAGSHTVRVRGQNLVGTAIDDLWTFATAVPDRALEILEPASMATILSDQVSVLLQVHNNLRAPQQVKANGKSCFMQDRQQNVAVYFCSVALAPGENTIAAEAVFDDGTVLTRSHTVVHEPEPSITIDTPSDLQVFGSAPNTPGNASQLTGIVARAVEISGHASTQLVSVRVNQQEASLSNDGRSFQFHNYFLHEGTNIVNAVGIDAHGRATTATITVYVDQTAPLLSLDWPEPESATSDQFVLVSGQVVDAVGPIIGRDPPKVYVKLIENGTRTEANIDGNRFLSPPIALQVGKNILEIEAEDALGNRRVRRTEVVRIQGGKINFGILSGNLQRAAVGTVVPDPLSVIVTDAAGAPIANQAVHFSVVRGSGSFENGPDGQFNGLQPARNVVVMSNGDGIASVAWRLGVEAGSGGQVVRAELRDSTAVVAFHAAAEPQLPAALRSDGTSASQFVQAGTTAFELLTVNVIDAHGNPVPSVPLQFEVQGDGGKLVANSEVTVTDDGRHARVHSDQNGVAAVRFLAGNRAGLVRAKAILASTDGIVIDQVPFQLQVLAPQSGPTAFVGRVADHTGVPLAGVQLSIERTNLTATTDANGLFEFTEQVPIGRIDLFVDGRSVASSPTIEYPALHFEALVVPGQRNQLMHIIHIPGIDRSRSVQVGGAESAILTLPGIDGFAMKVKPFSVTFPDGSHTGPLTVTAVHADRLPMLPQGGTSMLGAVAWTIQPSGTRFDPPIEVTMPNLTGLQPGRSVTIFQWDHDLATFVSMGLAHVSEDGATLVSEPGLGISKAGWGGGPPPVPPNDGENDPDYCQVRGADQCECKEADDVQRPVWTIREPEAVSFTRFGRLGNTLQVNASTKEPLACVKCSDGDLWYITGGDALDNLVYYATDIPDPSQNGQLVPRQQARIEQTIEHEDVHATEMDDIKTAYWQRISGKFGTQGECQAATADADMKLQEDYNREVYQQCIHVDHAGEALMAPGPGGQEIDSGLRYPLSAGMPGFTECERLPRPH